MKKVLNEWRNYLASQNTPTKVTQRQLKQLIKEEIQISLKEQKARNWDHCTKRCKEYGLGEGGELTTCMSVCTGMSSEEVAKFTGEISAKAGKTEYGTTTVDVTQPGPRTEYGTTTVDVTRPECQTNDDCYLYTHACKDGKCVDKFDIDLPAPVETGISKACKVKCAGKVFDILPGRAQTAYDNFFRDPASKVENAKEWHALQACHKKCLGPSLSDRINAYMRKNPNASEDEVARALGIG